MWKKINKYVRIYSPTRMDVYQVSMMYGALAFTLTTEIQCCADISWNIQHTEVERDSGNTSISPPKAYFIKRLTPSHSRQLHVWATLFFPSISDAFRRIFYDLFDHKVPDNGQRKSLRHEYERKKCTEWIKLCIYHLKYMLKSLARMAN